MSFRNWLSIITALFIIVILYVSREDLAHAWQLLSEVNIWILLLLLPIQGLLYYAGGEAIFSYLRGKGVIKETSALRLARMSLEMNFVNHVLPSAGVSGISYMNWRLGKEGVPASKALMSQIVRFAMTYVGFIALTMLAVIAITIDGSLNRWTILFSAVLVVALLGVIFGGMFLFNSQSRMNRFSKWLTRTVNVIVRKVTFGRKRTIINRDRMEHFFDELHDDYMALRRDRNILKIPLFWGTMHTVSDVLIFFVTFLALGQFVNPAVIVLAYGVATLSAFVAVTPGGAGVYELLMIFVLSGAGVPQGIAIAGIVLARVVVLLSIICIGWIFYQHSLIKYGKPKQKQADG